MYKYTTTAPIIKACCGGVGGRLNQYSSSSNYNPKMLTVVQLRNKGKVKGEKQQKGRRKGRRVLRS